MIIVKNRTLLFANREQYLGTSYDNNSAVRIFQVPRISIDGVDIANLTFVANLKKSNGAKVSSYLEKEIRDEEIILVWEIKNEALNPAGTMFLNLRATDSNGTVRWSTYPAVVYAEGSIDAPEVSGDAVLGFEQMVARSEELIMELEESEGERVEAEQFREEAEEERASRAEALYGQLGDAIRSADEAAAKANAAAGRLDEVGDAIDSANKAAAVAVKAAENANVAAGVANSASQTATEAKAAAESASQTATEAKAAAGNTATEVSSLRTEVAQQKSDLNEHESAKNPHGTSAEDVGALPITGGTLSGSKLSLANAFASWYANNECLAIYTNEAKGDETNRRCIYLYNNTSKSLKEAFRIRDNIGGVANWYNIFGEHNKPSGTYNGNGDATERVISTGGIGNALLIKTDTTFAIVTSSGAITLEPSSGNIKALSSAKYSTGYLYLYTAESWFNASGVTYTYEIL